MTVEMGFHSQGGPQNSRVQSLTHRGVAVDRTNNVPKAQHLRPSDLGHSLASFVSTWAALHCPKKADSQGPGPGQLSPLHARELKRVLSS